MNFWKGKNVFVTGCNGFVGAWLVKVLHDEGANITGLIRDIIPDSALTSLGYMDKIKIVYGDAENYEIVARALNEYDIDICFHLAAQSQVGVANRSPVSTFKTNIIGTLNILEASRCLGSLKGIVVASSDKAYGRHTKLPYKEDFSLKGTYPYDASKACADIISQSYANTYDLPVAVARCGNIFGPADMNLRRIVPDTMRSLILGTSPIIRSDGKYKRDYIYVLDAVAAYLSLAKGLVDKKGSVSGECFNFGTGRPITVLDLVRMMIKISGKKNIRPKILNIAKGEIRAQYLSSQKAGSVLGWRASCDLEEALKDTYQWYENFFKE